MSNHTTIRVEPDKKAEFAQLCDDMGLTVSGAINIFIAKVLQCRRIPFEISADSDPFYSETNQKFLLESIAQLERGEGNTYNDVSEILSEFP
ncbi:MAG: type II toxin-antitoxin system RelB/DinJ family antitoxin [Oscillospiraceae bacterium]|nr:type II toxin-antitoxin system RelB/DinJ family antitoxin [Oscillospiraceae bacterium]